MSGLPPDPASTPSIFAFKTAHWKATSSIQRNEYLIGCFSVAWREGRRLFVRLTLPANKAEVPFSGCVGWALHDSMWHPWMSSWRTVVSGSKFAGLSFYVHSEQDLHYKTSQVFPEFLFLLLHPVKSLVLFKGQFKCWCLWTSPWRLTPPPQN